MPQYRVTERSFINNQLAETDAVVEYDGKPGPNLEPMDASAEAASEAAGAEMGVRNISVGDMTRQKVAAVGGDPEAVDAAAAITAAGLAASAALDGRPVIVDGKVVELIAPPPKPAGSADGLV